MESYRYLVDDNDPYMILSDGPFFRVLLLNGHEEPDSMYDVLFENPWQIIFRKVRQGTFEIELAPYVVVQFKDKRSRFYVGCEKFIVEKVSSGLGGGVVTFTLVNLRPNQSGSWKLNKICVYTDIPTGESIEHSMKDLRSIKSRW